MEIRMRKEEGGVALELHGLKVDEALALAGSFLEGCDKILKVAKFVSVHPELGDRLKEIDRKKLELKSDAELQELNDEALQKKLELLLRNLDARAFLEDMRAKIRAQRRGKPTWKGSGSRSI